MMEGGDTDESWKLPDECLPAKNQCHDYPVDADFSTEIHAHKLEVQFLPPNHGVAETDGGRTLLPMPVNRDSRVTIVKYEEPSMMSGVATRNQQGLHGKQATKPSSTTKAISYPIRCNIIYPVADINFDVLQDTKKAREAQAQKWSAEMGGQVPSCASK